VCPRAVRPKFVVDDPGHGVAGLGKRRRIGCTVEVVNHPPVARLNAFDCKAVERPPVSRLSAGRGIEVCLLEDDRVVVDRRHRRLELANRRFGRRA